MKRRGFLGTALCAVLTPWRLLASPAAPVAEELAPIIVKGDECRTIEMVWYYWDEARGGFVEHRP
jgi:hypothetical protein